MTSGYFPGNRRAPHRRHPVRSRRGQARHPEDPRKGQQGALAAAVAVRHHGDDEPARRFPAHGAGVLHVPNGVLGLLVRPAARDAHGLRERAARGAVHLLQPRRVRAGGVRRSDSAPVAGHHRLGRHARRYRVSHGLALRAPGTGTRRPALHLSRRVDDPQDFISKNKYTENHSYRVSVYETKIAGSLNLQNERIEDIRAAALLHDIGKLDISRELLYKAARLTADEFTEIKAHVNKGSRCSNRSAGCCGASCRSSCRTTTSTTAPATTRRPARRSRSSRGSSVSPTSTTR
ncbi:MAG: hypothetical protein CL471_17955 [Acidobacteria bacterium]|nr:hypothetical protein [Acidobacteriota bacterium]